MDTKVIDFKINDYIEYPYLQSKKAYESATPLDESHSTPVPAKSNPFSIEYRG